MGAGNLRMGAEGSSGCRRALKGDGVGGLERELEQFEWELVDCEWDLDGVDGSWVLLMGVGGLEWEQEGLEWKPEASNGATGLEW